MSAVIEIRTTKDVFVVDGFHINTIIGTTGGRIDVDKNITFVSGSMTGNKGGYYVKSGEGTHEISGLRIDGDIYVNRGKTILLNNEITNAALPQRAGQAFISNNAELDIHHGVTLQLSGGMTINDGTVTNFGILNVSGTMMINGGTVTNSGIIKAATLDFNKNGTLYLPATPKEFLGEHYTTPAPMVSVGTLGNDARIRVVGGHFSQPGSYTFENLLEVTKGITDANIAALNGHQTALYRSTWSADEGNSLGLTVRILTVQEYVSESGWTAGNATAIADLFDAHFYPENPAEEAETYSIMARSLNESNEDQVAELLQSLQNLSPAEFNTVLRTAMAGELVGNAARMVMSSPQRTVFRQLDWRPPASSPRNWLGQARAPANQMRLWFAPYAQSEEGSKDHQTFDGYSLTRAGLMVGGDVQITHQIIGGWVFHYGNPNVKSDLGKINADDFMIGLYMKLPIYWQITANAMIAYGAQQYTYQSGGNKTKFDGDMIFGSLEFTRPFNVLPRLSLAPIVGVDFQSIGMDDFNITLPGTLGNMSIAPDGLDSVMVRVGLQGECFAARVRAQYIRHVSKDDFMMSSITMIGTPGTTNIRSVQWGKDWVNIGLGYDFIQQQNFRLSADYDFDISKNTSSHLATLRAVLAW
jgi:outer membrane autotransporter protein